MLFTKNHYFISRLCDIVKETIFSFIKKSTSFDKLSNYIKHNRTSCVIFSSISAVFGCLVLKCPARYMNVMYSTQGG